MKKVYVAAHPTEAHLVKGLLENEGIAADVLGETPYGEIPIPAAVCIKKDSDFARARKVVEQYDRQDKAKGRGRPRWQCSNCGEMVEAQFTSCWQCGAAQPNAR